MFIVIDDGGGIFEYFVYLVNVEFIFGLLLMRECVKLINGEFDIF